MSAACQRLKIIMCAATKTTISVVIPVHNCARYLAQAIDSVLTQTHAPAEVLIVDDGSTDESAAVAHGYGSAIKYIHQEQGGAARARNAGVDASSCEYIAFLDADDIWLPDKISRQLLALEKHADKQACFGHMQQFVSDDAIQAKGLLAQAQEVLPGYSPCTLLIKKSDFMKVGYFEADWQVGEFIAWFAAAQDAGIRMLMLPEVVALRRLHDSNQGVQKTDMRSHYALVVKSILDKRRKAN